MESKLNDYEVRVTVVEYYIVQAYSELGAFMRDLEDPTKVIVLRRTIKKVKQPKKIIDHGK